jgi:hypothetical protein
MSFDVIFMHIASEPDVLAIVAIAGFVGGMYRGYSGFGFSMGAVPILSTVLAPSLAVPSVLFLELAIAAFTLKSERAHIAYAVVSPILAGALVGTPLGLALLSHAPDDLMRIIMGFFVAGAILIVWRRRRSTITVGKRGLIVAGLISGLMNGGSAMSGPPVVVAVMATDLPAQRIRGTLIFYIACSATIALVLTFIGGLQTPSTLSVAVMLAPCTIIGAFIGARLFVRYGARGYRSVGLGFLLIVAIVSVISGLRGVLS